ncbi:MAG TPA: zinc-binding alcohol dehydrogenase family protein [Thermoplasmata archaeon]|nr:zinc-binding alcohol dehydrogenase family protein [Thermoplasmata archaeon]
MPDRATMHAMYLAKPASAESNPLRPAEVPTPAPGPGELLVRVDFCGVCRTDLHIVEGELPPLRERVIPGHEVVGHVAALGRDATGVAVGDLVGIPWLHSTCGECEFCRSGRENLCERKSFTGYSVDGGYAEYAVARDRFVLPLSADDAARRAPFLCAGIIGYRALKLVMPPAGGRIGFFGFGGSAHLTLPVAARLGYETVAYSRNPEHLRLAARLGASETVLLGGKSTETPNVSRPARLDAAVVFSPSGETVLEALRELKKGAALAIAAIHLSPIPPIDYDRWLFGERRILSVEANTRADAREFLDLADRLRLDSTIQLRPLAQANEALADLKAGRVTGAVVLDCRAGGSEAA